MIQIEPKIWLVWFDLLGWGEVNELLSNELMLFP